MRCPSCGSDSCFPISETKTEGIDVTSSCCGYIILGPIGILCGLCNTGSSTTREYWKCGNCGRRFR